VSGAVVRAIISECLEVFAIRFADRTGSKNRQETKKPTCRSGQKGGAARRLTS